METQEESVVHLTPTEADLLAMVGAAPDGRLHSRDQVLLARAPRRTRYTAWQRLEEAGLVAIKTSLLDTRNSVFVLQPAGRTWLEANGRSSPAAPAADELNKPPGTVQAPQPMTETPEWRLAPPPVPPAKPDGKGVVYGRLGSSIIVHAFNRGDGLVKALCNPGEFFAAEDASKFKRELAFKGPGNLPCQNCEKVMAGTFKPKLFVPVPKPEALAPKVDPSEPVPVAQAPLPTSGNCATCGLGGSKGPDGFILHHHVNNGLVARTLRGRGGCKSFRVPRPAPVAAPVAAPVPEPKVEAPVEPVVVQPVPAPVLRPSLHDKPPAKPPCADCKRYIVVTVLKGRDGRALCARCKRLEDQLPVGAAPNDPSAPNEAKEPSETHEPEPVVAPVVVPAAPPARPTEKASMPKPAVAEVPKVQTTKESPTMSTRRTKKTSKPQAPCSVCHEPYTVNASNKVRKHGLPEPCKGSGKPPAKQNAGAELGRAIEAKRNVVVHTGLARALEKKAKEAGKPVEELTEKAAAKIAQQRLVKAKANPEKLLTGKQLKDNIAAKRVAKVAKSKAPAKVLKPLAKKPGARPTKVASDLGTPAASDTLVNFLEKFQVKECEMVYTIGGIESHGRGKLLDLLQLCRDLDLKQLPWKLISVKPAGGR